MKEKIRHLKKYYTNKQVYDKLWWKVSLSLIEKIKVKDRNIINVCNNCWKTFYYMRYKKYCTECSWYYWEEKNKEQKIKANEEKRAREKFLKETIRITWLKRKEINKLNRKYTQTEIRELYKLNK